MKSSVGHGAVLALASGWLLSGVASGVSIDAWLVPNLTAPQLVMHDDATGNIFYSLCNSTDAPVFPADDTAAFDLKYAPLKGTGLSGFGYMDGEKIVAQMFYQTDGGAIVDASFFCNNATGRYNSTDRQFIVSAGVAGLPEIRQPSPLRALAVGATAGQRIYFRDEDNQPAVLGYHPDAEQWQFNGYVLQANNMTSYSGSMGAAILGTRNITVALPIDKDIGISRLGSKTWDLTAFPTPILASPKAGDAKSSPVQATNETGPDDWTLTYDQGNAPDFQLNSFDGASANLGLAFSTTGKLSAFYIGSNGVLHRVDQGEGDNFQRAEQEGPDTWPVADAPNSPFGIASDFNTNRIWVYYMSGGEMRQLYQSKSDVWERAVVLETREALSPASGQGSGNGNGQGSGDSSGQGDSGDDDENKGMGTGAKVGLGVGLSVGVLTLGGLIGAASWFYRRRRAKNGVAELPGSVHGPAKSPASPTSPTQDLLSPESAVSPQQNQAYQNQAYQNQAYYPVEKQGTELFELPIQGQRHEMDNTQIHEAPRHEVHEMPGDTFVHPGTR